MSITFNVGDEVEVAGHRMQDKWLSDNGYCPEGIVFFDTYDTLPPDDQIVWTKVTVGKVFPDEIQVYYDVSKKAPWHLLPQSYGKLVRHCGGGSQQVASGPTATSCKECKTVFMYPVEYNLSDGRLCFSCVSTYKWKYPDLQAH